MQKMPYKHIAAHLNKTELACRLHYHQLSHGSNRRKRTASHSSGSDKSPTMAASAPSPSHDRISRSISPPRPMEGYTMTPPQHDMQLPRMMPGNSPRVPAILPKPASMGFNSRASSPLGYPPAIPDRQHTPMPPVTFRRESSLPTMTPPLRLECSPMPFPSAVTHTPAHVDLNRLQAIYAAHRDKFWEVIAHEYGPNMPPATLEQAWKTGRCCNPGHATLASPKDEPHPHDRTSFTIAAGRDKTRISSLISAD
ncbi:hypothetical protein K4F52_005258 [Lecanicillium sp. MT-2017a]|nr:hypothetical protein K4F52_005258 [Lecanicillium sp. MT-2017a]